MQNELNPAQAKALDTLRAQAALGFPSRSKYGSVVTGVNTTTLHSLRKLGFISCTGVYLRGQVTADIEVK